MRLVDAEILAFDIKVKRDYLDTSSVVGRGEYIALNKALVMIDEQPTIDAVEVVHCRECKWWDRKENSNYGYCHACKHGHYSEHWEIQIYRTYKDDWFCADGERKNDE